MLMKELDYRKYIIFPQDGTRIVLKKRSPVPLHLTISRD
jgi:hypothetical protein